MIVLSKDADVWNYVADIELAEAIKNGNYRCNKGDLFFIDCNNLNIEDEMRLFINMKDSNEALMILSVLKALDMDIHPVWFNNPYSLGSGATIILKILINALIYKRNLYINNWGNSLHHMLPFRAIQFFCKILEKTPGAPGLIFSFNATFSDQIIGNTGFGFGNTQHFDEESKTFTVGTWLNNYKLNAVVIERIDGDKFYNWYN